MVFRCGGPVKKHGTLALSLLSHKLAANELRSVELYNGVLYLFHLLEFRILPSRVICLRGSGDLPGRSHWQLFALLTQRFV